MTPLEIAKKELGVKEFPGSSENQRIIEYDSVTTLKAARDEIPWCAAFVCWCLEKAGYISPKSAWARSFEKWGEETKTPVEGDIVLFWRGKDATTGHVAFFIAQVGGVIIAFGGNQSDQVCYSLFPNSSVISYRKVPQR